MPPSVLRYETPPTTQLASQSQPIRRTPRHRGDENPSAAPTARSRYRVATPPPPNNQQSVRRNADQAAARLSPHPAHAPTVEAAPPIAPRPPAAHAAPEPRSHSPAYESHRRGADPTADAQRRPDRSARGSPVATCGLRYAPSASVRWRFRPRRSLRFARRPPPHQPARDNRRPISVLSAPWHHDKPKPPPQRRRITPPRTAGASTRIHTL